MILFPLEMRKIQKKVQTGGDGISSFCCCPSFNGVMINPAPLPSTMPYHSVICMRGILMVGGEWQSLNVRTWKILFIAWRSGKTRAWMEVVTAIVCRRLHMALLSYYFHHGSSSSFDAMCGAFAHTNLNANPSEHWTWMAEQAKQENSVVQSV